MDDRALAARALEGDERAFAELFDTYFPRLFRFALRRVDSEDAEGRVSIRRAAGDGGQQ
jgi:DNA-directed RNA polymerase specialized sigma24 family protein